MVREGKQGEPPSGRRFSFCLRGTQLSPLENLLTLISVKKWKDDSQRRIISVQLTINRLWTEAVGIASVLVDSLSGSAGGRQSWALRIRLHTDK
jgi:hypothetical protein